MEDNRKKMTLTDLVAFLGDRSIEEQIEFNDRLLFEMTIMNRAIWSDPGTSDKTKIECLKWANELAHQIWNITHSLEQGQDENSENRLGEHIQFYGRQTEEFTGHLAATVNNAIKKYRFIEKE